MTGMSRAAVLLLVVVGVTGAADAQAPEEDATDDLQTALIYPAEIRSMVETCMEETPEVAAHLQQTHQDWLARHPAITTKLAELRSGSQSAQADAQVVEQAAQEQAKRLRR